MASAAILLGGSIETATPAEVESISVKAAKDQGDRILHAIQRRQRPVRRQLIASAAAISGTPTILSLGSPAAGRMFNVLAFAIVGSDDHTQINQAGFSTPGPIVVTSNGAFVAGGAGSAALGPLTPLITGFDVYIGPAAAPVTGVVTVTNVNGGPFSYQLSDGVAGGSLSIRYPVPIGQAGNITVNVPAIAGGGAGTITVYGESVQTLPTAALYTGDPANINIGDLCATFLSIPSTANFSKEVFWCHAGETVTGIAYGVATGQVVTAMAQVADMPWEGAEPSFV